MKVLVAVKQVAALDEDFEIRADGKDVDRDFLVCDLNEWDDYSLEEAMKKKHVSKAGLAKMLRTSRTQVNRLLDPASDVTLSSLQRAAKLVGREVRLELV